MDYEPLDNFCAWRQAKPKLCLYIVNIPFVLTKLNQEDLILFWGVFNKTIIPLKIVGYEMITTNLAL